MVRPDVQPTLIEPPVAFRGPAIGINVGLAVDVGLEDGLRVVGLAVDGFGVVGTNVAG